MVAKLAGGNHLPSTTIEPISPSAQPMPIRLRPAPSIAADSAAANTAAPATATSIRQGMVTRGPSRSSMMPTGSWARPKARKNSPMTPPMVSALSDSSCIRSGAMTVGEAR